MKTTTKQLFKSFKYFEFKDNYPDFNLGSLLVAIFCSFLIVAATFTLIEFGHFNIPVEMIKTPFDFFSSEGAFGELIKYFYYIPQIPIVIFAGALLGPRLGVLSVGLYVFAGLCGLPIFAFGGGIDYVTKLSFGYIIGYLVGVHFIGTLLKKKVSSFNLLKATVLSVFSIHLIGIIYLSVFLLFKQESIYVILSWIWIFSGLQILYDLIISFIAAALGRPVRSVLWLAMD